MSTEILTWLSDFQNAVVKRDFASGRNLYSESPNMFGTRVNFSTNIQEYFEQQWRVIWESSWDFKFTKIIEINTNANMGFCAVTWSNMTRVGTEPIYREGRATFIFQNLDGKLQAVHSHISENPVPSN